MHDRPTPGRPPARPMFERTRVRERVGAPPLYAVPPLLPEPAGFVSASPDAESEGWVLIREARAEAHQEGLWAAHYRELAAGHARTQGRLLTLARMTEEVLRA